MEYLSNPPDASALMMSARSFGNYDLAGALADLIDNSINAKAKNIILKCLFNGARQSVGISSLNGSDAVLMAWMEKEEALFRILERHLVAERLRQGFGEDVDAFIKFSLGVQNRRKSRVGHALENHLEEVFKEHAVACTRGKMTDNRAKPDFIFPGIGPYHDPEFPSVRLSMLGVKSTCKDRWRQVLSEARRIERKHLFTLEPGISENQTTEMTENKLTLVLPKSLHNSYKTSQQEGLMQLINSLNWQKKDRPHRRRASLVPYNIKSRNSCSRILSAGAV